MEALNLDITYFSLLLLATFVLKDNRDEKSMGNTDARIYAVRI